MLELGVQFPDSFSLTVLPPADASRLTLGNLGGVNRDRVGVSVSSLLVNLKRTVGDVNTLSAPKIRVKNKEKAKVLVGDKIPIITATNGTGGFVSDSVNYIDVGLKLEVEPAVYNDDDVVIKVGLEVSSAGNQVKSPSGTIAYQIGTRSASTVLRLRDGQTQLLAGLISREERSNSSRLPGLGDVPVLVLDEAGRIKGVYSKSSLRPIATGPVVLEDRILPPGKRYSDWVFLAKNSS